MSYLQTLDAVSGCLERGLLYCKQNSIHPEQIVETRIFPGTPPFRFHIQHAVYHSRGALDAIRSGVLHMPAEQSSHDYAALQALIIDTRGALRKLQPDEINSREGADVVFEVRGQRKLFTAEGFLLSFSLPNFHFHSIAAHNILRSSGVPVDKLDYIGALRLKE